jgi:protein-S-isoprenylcysteine O-methyltransferase Ste14
MKKLPTRRGDLRYWLVLAGLLVMTPHPWATAAGAGLVAIGAALHLWAKGCLRQDAELTTWGPYAWVRHPFYLANGLADAGVLLLAGNPWLAAAVVPLWIWIYARTIAREERRLVEMFDDAYRWYRAMVPALIPCRAPIPSVSHFSWANPNLRRGREIARVLRLLAYPALFVGVAALKQGQWSHTWALAVFVLLHAVAWLVGRRRASDFSLLPSEGH